ncbi:hypothetical protein N8J89_07935 [Crossiella sp. CA-258035]|uniref:hypothetical protein n=1 Tax=Crossiella sp. CA-258035 TaxID=2981138 RepID=UPI0024BC743E|nr:hypothetical protein [Crossiella sp. CA-258035]WHT20984.1 hypothetical protein N8J89_07935 [Crossiella sp. CA-258035]
MITNRDVEDHWAHPPRQRVFDGERALGVRAGDGKVLVSVEDGDALVAFLRFTPRQADFLMTALGMAICETEKT